MLNSVEQFFSRFIAPAQEQTEHPFHGLQVASAALLVELMRADWNEDATERKAMERVLRQRFQLSDEETGQLLALAGESANAATCLHEFTRLINQSCSAEERVSIIEMLWEVAYADQKLHKYEEHLIRKVADLLHVRHSDLIRAKHRAGGLD